MNRIEMNCNEIQSRVQYIDGLATEEHFVRVSPETEVFTENTPVYAIYTSFVGKSRGFCQVLGTYDEVISVWAIADKVQSYYSSTNYSYQYEGMYV